MRKNRRRLEELMSMMNESRVYFNIDSRNSDIYSEFYQMESAFKYLKRTFDFYKRSDLGGRDAREELSRAVDADEQSGEIFKDVFMMLPNAMWQVGHMMRALVELLDWLASMDVESRGDLGKLAKLDLEVRRMAKNPQSL